MSEDRPIDRTNVDENIDRLLARCREVGDGAEPLVERALALGFVTAADIDACRAMSDEARRRGKEIGLAQLLIRQRLIGPEEYVECLRSASQAPPFDRYEGAHEIGRGGIGRILRAVDPRMGREVAIKVLRSEAADRPGLRARFLAEARITGQLEHPGIVPAHEASVTAAGVDYFSMKLVRGRTLAEHLEDARSDPTAYPLQRRLADFVKVCEAIAYAHSRGVIHRDLKPSNIMKGEFGEILVMDWGLAKVLPGAQVVLESDLAREAEARSPSSPGPTDRRHTVEGDVMGTPDYMSPEQASGRVGAIDERSDVYSLGATLREMLAVGPEPDAGIPWELEQLVGKAMSTRQGDRHATARELGDELEAFLDGRRLASVTYPLSGLAGLWLRRHRRLVGAVAALALAALLALGAATWREESRRSERARALVEEALTGLEGRDDPERLWLAALESGREEPSASDQETYAAYRAAAVLLERALALRSDPETIGRRRDIGLRLARIATLCGDHETARSEVLRAAIHGASPATVEERLAEIEAHRNRRLERERRRIEEILARLESGRDLARLAGLAQEIASLRNPYTVPLIAAFLDRRIETDRPGWREVSLISFACRVLATLGWPEGYPVLDDLARSVDDPQTIEHAAVAMLRTGHPEAVEGAVRALARLGRAGNVLRWRRFARRFEGLPLPDRLVDPEDDGDLSTRAFLHLVMGRFADAERDLDRVLGRGSGGFEERLHRALARTEQGDHGGALTDLEAARPLRPRSPYLMLVRATVLHRSGDLEGAGETFARLRQRREFEGDRNLSLPLAAYLFDRARIEAAAGRSEAAEAGRRQALELAEQAMRRSGSLDPEVAHLVARIRASSGDAMGALDVLDLAERIDPLDEMTQVLRCRLLLDLRREAGFDEPTTGLLSLLELAIDLAPRLPEIHHLLGLATGLGVDGSRSHLDEATGLYVDRGQAYLEKGDAARARADLENARRAGLGELPELDSWIDHRGVEPWAVWVELGELLVRIEGSSQRARTCLTRAVAEAPRGEAVGVAQGALERHFPR